MDGGGFFFVLLGEMFAKGTPLRWAPDNTLAGGLVSGAVH